jgi:hypothetical protein
VTKETVPKHGGGSAFKGSIKCIPGVYFSKVCYDNIRSVGTGGNAKLTCIFLIIEADDDASLLEYVRRKMDTLPAGR